MEYMGPVESNWPVKGQHLDTLRAVIVHNAEPGDWLCPEWMATCGVCKPADIPASPWQSVNDQLLAGVQWLSIVIRGSQQEYIIQMVHESH